MPGRSPKKRIRCARFFSFNTGSISSRRKILVGLLTFAAALEAAVDAAEVDVDADDADTEAVADDVDEEVEDDTTVGIAMAGTATPVLVTVGARWDKVGLATAVATFGGALRDVDESSSCEPL